MRGLLAKLFNKMDDSHTGTLTLSDIEKHFDDEEVRALFETLEPSTAKKQGPVSVVFFKGISWGIIRNHDIRIHIKQTV